MSNSYTSPEPEGLAEELLRPETAEWLPRGERHLAVLRYENARVTRTPRESILEFYESAYEAGARHAGWDLARLASPAWVTARTQG